MNKSDQPGGLQVPASAATATEEKKRNRVAERWTPKLAGTNHTPVVNAFLTSYAKLGISQAEAMFILHLMSFKWDEKAPFPSNRLMAERMGIQVRRVRAIAQSLEDKNLLRRNERRRERDRSETNTFDLKPLFEKLEAHVDQDVTPRRGRSRKSTARGGAA
jgi:DNA replication protein